jgi:hypothetical protein
MVVRDEMSKVFDKKMKILTKIFITRQECLAIHQGRNTIEEVNTLSLNKAKFKFWTKLTGLMTGLAVLIGLLISYITSKLS